MGSFRVVLKPSVEKDLRSVPKGTLQRILTRIEALAEDPSPRQSAKLTGVERLYHLRVGDYRVVYGVHTEERSIIVHYVRHRREAYRDGDGVSSGKERLQSVCSVLPQAFWPS